MPLLTYHPMVEQTNGVAYDWAGSELDGAITGATLGATGPGDDLPQMTADGVNDIITLPAGALTVMDTALATGRLGIHIWGKTSVWDDATERWLFYAIVDANNVFGIARAATDDRILFHLIAGGTSEDFEVDISSPVTDMALGIDINLTDSEFEGFHNGAQVGATQAIAGTWAGSLASAQIFAKPGPASVWSGSGGRLIGFDGLLPFAAAGVITP